MTPSLDEALATAEMLLTEFFPHTPLAVSLFREDGQLTVRFDLVDGTGDTFIEVMVDDADALVLGDVRRYVDLRFPMARPS